MVVDFELTLNRFGFRWVADNKLQLGWLRVSWWNIPGKHAASFEVNWRTKIMSEPKEGERLALSGHLPLAQMKFYLFYRGENDYRLFCRYDDGGEKELYGDADVMSLWLSNILKDNSV